MDAHTILVFLKEILFLLVVLGVVLGYGMMRGRQSLINLILALYFALLLSLEFPYYDHIADTALIKIAVFGIFTFLSLLVFNRLMPRDYESAFEGIGKKLLYALLATVLVMIFSFHVLPVTELITPGSPLQTLFGSAEYFFWWLLVPLVFLFLI